MTNLKVIICTGLGMLGSFMAKAFGGWTEDMVTLLIFMVIDFAMGLMVAGVFHKSKKSDTGALNSRAGWKGLCKKGVTLLFVLVSFRLDVLLETDYIKATVVIGFIVNEAISIVENAGLMGVPMPSIILKALEVLREKGTRQDEDSKD